MKSVKRTPPLAEAIAWRTRSATPPALRSSDPAIATFVLRWPTCTVLVVIAVNVTLGVLGIRTVSSSPPSSAQVQSAASDESTTAARRVSDSAAGVGLLWSAAASTDELEDRCRRLLAASPNSERDRDLVGAIERWGEMNPSQALAWVAGCTDAALQAVLFDAAFRGWGRADANRAMDWIFAQTAAAFDRDRAVVNVLKGASRDPAVAIQVMVRASEHDPEQARDYGDALIYAFAQNRAFASAAGLATTVPGELRTEWLDAAYGSWTKEEPQAAAASALGLTDAEARRTALDAVIASWSASDPQGLADFTVAELPAGEQRTRALSTALVQWSAANPTAAAEWINRFGASPEFDQGEAAIATQQEVMRQPATALRWAQVVADANLRSHTIAAVLQTWALSNAAAVTQYLQTSADLLPEDRTALRQTLSSEGGR